VVTPKHLGLDEKEVYGFLDLLEMTPIMHWTAYKKAPNHNPEKCILTNITTPMIDKMVQLFLRVNP